VRLFAALMLPSEVTDWLQARQQAAATIGPDLRWTLPEQWHLTLAFFGQVEHRHVEDLRVRLARAAARRPDLRLGLADPGTFGSVRRARVVWQGVGGDVAQVRALAASYRAAGRRVGLRADGLASRARFRPHVTLARLSPPGDVTEVLGALTTSEYPHWTSREAVLVRSDLGAGPRGRAQHTVVTRLPFEAGAGRR
jgi:2'-5' RNA ligase